MKKTPEKGVLHSVCVVGLGGPGRNMFVSTPPLFLMMRSEILFELKKAYEPFSVLWDEWTHSADCRLNTDEIYTMEVHRINDFQIDISDLIMYYNRPENTRELIRKLSMKSQYNCYKDFIIIRFATELINVLTANESLLPAPVPIYKLPVSREKKIVLLKFEESTVGALFNGCARNTFRKPDTFKLITDFLKLES